MHGRYSAGHFRITSRALALPLSNTEGATPFHSPPSKNVAARRTGPSKSLISVHVTVPSQRVRKICAIGKPSSLSS